MRDRIFNIVDGQDDSFLSRFISWIIVLTILVSSIAFVLESVSELYAQYRHEFYVLEIVVVIIFTLEYLIRFITVRRRLAFMVKPLNIVDILAILPFYMELLLSGFIDLRILRIIRLVRVFRLFKMAKYSDSLALTLEALRDTGAALITLAILMSIVLVMSSSVMYFAEHDAHISYCGQRSSDGTFCQGKWIEGTHAVDRPECPVCHHALTLPTGNAQVAKNFRSILSTFWWCIVTMTTVGYGDVVPQTVLGKIVAGLTMLGGILCIALPTGVMATAFMNRFDEARKKKQAAHVPPPPAPEEITCPHCRQKFKL